MKILGNNMSLDKNLLKNHISLYYHREQDRFVVKKYKDFKGWL